jgi:hypothetical protein
MYNVGRRTKGFALAALPGAAYLASLRLSGHLEAWRVNECMEPGNFGDPFGTIMYKKEMRSKEIKLAALP